MTLCAGWTKRGRKPRTTAGPSRDTAILVQEISRLLSLGHPRFQKLKCAWSIDASHLVGALVRAVAPQEPAKHFPRANFKKKRYACFQHSADDGLPKHGRGHLPTHRSPDFVRVCRCEAADVEKCRTRRWLKVGVFNQSLKARGSLPHPAA